MTYNVLMGTSNPTHSLTHSLTGRSTRVLTTCDWCCRDEISGPSWRFHIATPVAGGQIDAVERSDRVDRPRSESAVPRILQEESRGTAQENQSPVSAVHTNAGLQPGSRAPAQGSTGLSVKSVAGRSGLAVACLTAVREVLGSDRAVDSCVYHQKNTVIYSLGHGLCAPFLRCLGQLSLLPYVGW